MIRFTTITFLLIIISFLFWESASLFWVGMIPTGVAWVLDRSKQKSKALTVGAMNFAGCFPYLMGVWTAMDPATLSMRYLSDSLTIIVMYSAALVGYLINYSTVFIFSSIATQRATARIQKIDKEKQALEARWGKKVSGDLVLNERGFPLEKQPASKDKTDEDQES